MSMKQELQKANQERELLTKLRDEVYEKEKATLKKSLVDNVQMTKPYQTISPIISRHDKLLGIPQIKIGSRNEEDDEEIEYKETEDDEEVGDKETKDDEEVGDKETEDDEEVGDKETEDDDEEIEDEESEDDEKVGDEGSEDDNDEGGSEEDNTSSFVSYQSPMNLEDDVIDSSPSKNSVSSFTSATSYQSLSLTDYDVDSKLEAETSPEKDTRKAELEPKMSSYQSKLKNYEEWKKHLEMRVKEAMELRTKATIEGDEARDTI